MHAVKKLDAFARPITLELNHDHKYRTGCGVFATIISFLILSFYIIRISLPSFLYRKEYSFNSRSEYAKDDSDNLKFSLGNGNFKLAFGLQE